MDLKKILYFIFGKLFSEKGIFDSIYMIPFYQMKKNWPQMLAKALFNSRNTKLALKNPNLIYGH